ncbi:MAG TPA: FtsX-like permease family protein [Candidatus Kapabacteria bacterium]|nr:FtsX-like permease family protein [Candidatus Kapabacteria bacterium]
MKIPLSYSFRNLWTRKMTTIMTITGVGLVVFVFAAVLMLAAGLERTLVATGSDDNAIVLLKSAESETLSSIPIEASDIIASQPEVGIGSDGKPFLSKEVTTMINLQKKGGQPHDLSNIMVRGVSPAGVALRPQVKIVEGRMMNFGASEVIVSKKIVDGFDGAQLGGTLKFGGRTWNVVGLFDGGNSGFASEIWTDVSQLQQAFNRQEAFSDMILRMKDKESFASLKAKIEADPRLNELKVLHEKDFYAAESEALATFIRVLGLVVTIIFSFGAMIGAMITMYAAVANRTVEIGTLRALGFKRGSVLLAFLIESLLLSLIGGGVGLAIASLLQLVSVSTTNWTTWSEVSFGFALEPGIVIGTLIFSVVMGLVGGFLPSFRAARLDIISALRSS